MGDILDMRLCFNAARFVAAAVLLSAFVVAGCDDAASGTAGAGDGAVVAATAWPDDLPGAQAAAPDGQGDDVAAGRELFLATCSACHGAEGQGMPRQGPDLRASALLARSTDEQVVAFLVTGRTADDPQNATKLPMPPRGGNASLTDNHLGMIVKFLRTLQAAAEPVQAAGSSPNASEARSDVQVVDDIGR